MSRAEPYVRCWRPGRQLPMSGLLTPLRRGPGDPTHRRLGGGTGTVWWRATRNPEGPVLLRLAARGDELVAQAWGPGAEQALTRLPRLLGADDDPAGFVPRHPVLIEAHRQMPDLRIGATDAVGEALYPACLEQVVTGVEAYAAFAQLTRQHGELAPGPANDPDSPAHRMMLPPTAQAWSRIPSWDYLAAGVEQRRSRTLVGAAQRGDALERTREWPSAEADRALRSLRGVGAWTSAETRQRAHGDPDAWSIGDYHVGGMITWALTGEKRGDDVATELLAPYAGHRYRVQVLIGLLVGLPPRRGPRQSLPTHTPRATRGRS